MAEIDLSTLQPMLTEFESQGRTALLPALHAVQETYGYIPEEAAAAIGRLLNVPLADVFGVIDFYAMFNRKPVGKTVIHVCGDPACAMAGSDGVMKMLFQNAEHHREAAQAGDTVTVDRAACLGLCEHAPALLIQGAAVPNADKQSWEDLVSGKAGRPFSIVGGDIQLLTVNCGKGHVTNIHRYMEGGGYTMLRKALSRPPQDLVAEIKAAGLVGRGGAAFPTGVKWEAVAASDAPEKYVVCNADEAEPGTFKDRVMIEDDPHRVLEGIILCAFAVGAHKGYIYIRGEYTLQHLILRAAISEARQAGILGKNILWSGFDFDIEVRRGAGAYICGEETALFESIEGKRGFPRVKPPFPTTFGLFGKPTVINNVETLVNIPLILQMGSAAYRQIGTEKSPGPKLFCLSGDIVRPGLYEVPFGITFRHLLDELAGGMRPGRKFQAALFGGAAGAFAVAKDLDVRLTFEDLRAAGLPLGSGVITVFDETRDMVEILLRLGHFFADESCGKCYPCQLGTQRQFEILQRLAAGKAQHGDKERLLDVGWTMTDASLCGLGQTAASAVLSAVRLWPELFEFPENATASAGGQA